MNSKKAFTLIELLLIVSILIMTVTYFTYIYVEEKHTSIQFCDELQEPTVELHAIAEIVVNDVFQQGKIDVFEDIFSNDFTAYFNSYEKILYSREQFIDLLKIKYDKNKIDDPADIVIVYCYDKFMVYWKCGVTKYGLPNQLGQNCNPALVGHMVFKVKDSQIVKYDFFNKENDIKFNTQE